MNECMAPHVLDHDRQQHNDRHRSKAGDNVRTEGGPGPADHTERIPVDEGRKDLWVDEGFLESVLVALP